ncbi:uncharacterized protein LOC134719640 [Mytilus trossulus]|uniref:uncharacterized protein LOC134719640 n=1 Tax=Mytilus trossulus TaxID=6551 RepID=UPI003005A0C7
MYCPAMVILYLYILHAYNLLLEASLIKQTLYKSEPFCLLNSRIRAFNVWSDIQCARHCLSNAPPPCDATIWNSINKTCTVVQGVDGLLESHVKTTIDSQIYNTYKEGCTEFGYYYDSTTNTCLRLYHVANNKTWKDARNHCQLDGGDLISLPTREKWNFTVKFTYCAAEMWIGLKAEQWLTGEPFVNIYGIDPPILNNYDYKFPTDPEKHCGSFQSKSKNPLRDDSCNIRRKHFFVCEILIP